MNKKTDDINIIKHELLDSIMALKSAKDPAIVPDTVVDHALKKGFIRSSSLEVRAVFQRLWQDKYIEIREERMLKGRFFVTGLSTIGMEALLHKTFIKQFKKERRAKWNETGQILSPYISIAALLITATLFAVDKCSKPSSYQLTIGSKTYTIKEK